jgi:hypothetical protein
VDPDELARLQVCRAHVYALLHCGRVVDDELPVLELTQRLEVLVAQYEVLEFGRVLLQDALWRKRSLDCIR